LVVSPLDRHNSPKKHRVLKRGEGLRMTVLPASSLTNPRFAEAALQSNLKVVEAVKDLAAREGCSPAQFALAWVLAQGNDMIPIPGTKRVRYLEDNMGALAVNLTPDDLKETDERIRGVSVAGDRYTPEMMAIVNR